MKGDVTSFTIFNEFVFFIIYNRHEKPCIDLLKTQLLKLNENVRIFSFTQFGAVRASRKIKKLLLIKFYFLIII